MLDLNKNNPAKLAEVGYTFNLCLPDGSETEAKIKVRGANSKIVRDAAKRIHQELQMREKANKRRNKDEDLTIEEAEDLLNRSAASRIISWSGMGEEGKPLDFSYDEAVRVLSTYPFIREQVIEESDNILNFRPE